MAIYNSKTVLLVLYFLSKEIGYEQVHLVFFVKTAFQLYFTALERNPSCANNNRFSPFPLISEELHLRH